MSMQNFHSFMQRSPMRVAVQGQDSIYLAPVIPHKKLVGAQHYLPKHIRHEEILLLVDDTVFGSAKLGLVVTNAGLFYQTDFEDLAFYDFAHVLQVDVELGIVNKSLILNQHVKLAFTQLSRQGIQILCEFLDAFVQGNLGSQSKSQQQHQQHQYRSEDSQSQFSQRRTSQYRSSSLTPEQLQACQLLDLEVDQLNEANLKRAYRKKIADFHPDLYRQLPVSVQGLIEQHAQQLNQAREQLQRMFEHRHGKK